MSIFEKMMEDFSKQNSAKLLETCMTFNPKELKKVPLRYRIIALGFVQKLSLEAVNEKLAEAGCDQLYARNFLEAGLIYAFANHMTFKQWQELENYCSESPELIPTGTLYFAEQTISLRELRSYVERNSTGEELVWYTRSVTRYLEEQIKLLPNDKEQFRQFLLQNIHEFSSVREKARYYFCKYLYYYIEQKIQNYLESVESGFGTEDALSDLLILKGITALKRHQMKKEQILELLDHTSVSCGNIYDAFNYFYFEYVSSDWMEILLEYYGGDILNLPEEEKQRLAQAIKAYRPEWKNLSEQETLKRKCQEIEEAEIALDAAYALEGSLRGYQKNRSGEKSVRNYMKGKLDIDRTTLICYLIFFGKELDIEDSQMISIKRLNEILIECGYARLREADDFDYFILKYFEAEDSVDYLMDSVTNYAMENKNFFLYHMYNASVNNEEQLKKLLF